MHCAQAETFLPQKFMKKNTINFYIYNKCHIIRLAYILGFLVGQVDLIPGQVNFDQPLARGQVLEKIICQPLHIFTLKNFIHHV